MGLTPKQERFCQEFLLDLNGTRAYIRAGYSARADSARANSARLLSKAIIQERITELNAERMERTRVDGDRVLLELARPAFLDPRSIVEWGPDGIRVKASEELSEDDARAVAELSERPAPGGGRIVGVKFVDKLAALKLLGQHCGLFSERLEVSGPAHGPVRLLKVNRVTREGDAAGKEGEDSAL